MSLKVGVIGLGSMGYGIAQSVLRAGYETYGYDVVSAQQDRFASEGGATGELSDIAGSLDAVIVVVLNAAQTEAVLFGDEGIVSKMKAGSVVLASATVLPILRATWKRAALTLTFIIWTHLFQVEQPNLRKGDCR